MCKEGILFNVKGIPQGWSMLTLTLSHLVVVWALGRPCCLLKHNGEGVTPLLSRLCGMKHNVRAEELAFARTRSRVIVLANTSSPAFLQKRGWESSCFKIEPPRWPSKSESDSGVVGFTRMSPPDGRV